MKRNPTCKAREHLNMKECWCVPDLYYVTGPGNPIWVHHDDADRDARPPAQLMVDVIASLVWEEWDNGERGPA